jgi:hypothetical protein
MQAPDDPPAPDPDPEQEDRLGPGDLHDAFRLARRRAAAVPQAVRAQLARRPRSDRPRGGHEPPPTGA